MKQLAYLVMALAVAMGAISAATAYFVPIGASLPVEKPLELSAPAGLIDPALSDEQASALRARIANIRDAQAERRKAEAGDTTPLVVRERAAIDLPEVPVVQTASTGAAAVRAREALEPIAKKGDLLDEAMVELLRKHPASVGLVKVTSFNPGIWVTMWQSWVFFVSIVLLGGSALVIRRADAASHRAEESAGGTASDPVAIAERIGGRVRDLIAELGRTRAESDRLHLLVERLGVIQQEDVPAFAGARAALVTRFGLGGFAEVMDVFAAAERQINRAWSAAADGVEAESIDALERARAILPALEERLAGR